MNLESMIITPIGPQSPDGAAGGQLGFYFPFPASESEIENLSVEIAAKQLRSFGQVLRRNSREIAVNDPLVIADQAFLVLRKTHEFEASRVQALLLKRNVRIVLPRDRREILAVVWQDGRC